MEESSCEVRMAVSILVQTISSLDSVVWIVACRSSLIQKYYKPEVYYYNVATD
jgi:hypothetical protein